MAPSPHPVRSSWHTTLFSRVVDAQAALSDESLRRSTSSQKTLAGRLPDLVRVLLQTHSSFSSSSCSTVAPLRHVSCHPAFAIADLGDEMLQFVSDGRALIRVLCLSKALRTGLGLMLARRSLGFRSTLNAEQLRSEQALAFGGPIAHAMVRLHYVLPYVSRAIDSLVLASDCRPAACTSELRIVCARLPTIEEFNLSTCGAAATDEALLHCASLTRLRSIDLSWCKGLSDAGIMAFAARCASSSTSGGLRNVNVTRCSDGVTDATLKALAEHHPNLESIDLTLCRRVTTAGILVLLEQCHALQTITLDRCGGLDVAAVFSALGKQSPALRCLSVAGCDVTESALRTLAAGCPAARRPLQELNLSHCRFTEGCVANSLDALRSLTPQLQTIHMAGDGGVGEVKPIA